MPVSVAICVIPGGLSSYFAPQMNTDLHRLIPHMTDSVAICVIPGEYCTIFCTTDEHGFAQSIAHMTCFCSRLYDPW